MAQQVLRRVAEELRLESRDVSDALSTFDHLLRAYFARLLVGEFPAKSDVIHSSERSSGPRNSHPRSN